MGIAIKKQTMTVAIKKRSEGGEEKKPVLVKTANTNTLYENELVLIKGRLFRVLQIRSRKIVLTPADRNFSTVGTGRMEFFSDPMTPEDGSDFWVGQE